MKQELSPLMDFITNILAVIFVVFAVVFVLPIYLLILFWDWITGQMDY